MGQAWFGQYRLERKLGEGGMGQVWQAHDTKTDRVVALKVLPAELAADTGYRQRFEREARIAARLRGPHLVTIHTFGDIDGRLFIDMEYIEGVDVAVTLRDSGPMSPMAAVDIIAQVAAALDVIHRAGLVHRDIKPANSVVHPSGFVYLIDFGTAHYTGYTAITATGQAIGTLPYMAPERFHGTADPRSDIYALACVLYECLTGAKPFGNTEPAKQIHDHLHTAPPRAAHVNPRIPAGLDDVIARGMAKDPNQRYPSAGAFANAARTALTNTPPTAVMTTAMQTEFGPWSERAAPPAKRPGTPLRWLTMATAVLATVGTLAWISHQYKGTEQDSVPTTMSPGSTSQGADVTAAGPAPEAGQPCDPGTDRPTSAKDGTPLECTVANGRNSRWARPSIEDHPESKPDRPDKKEKKEK
ncbi:protein kinase [Nocardia sp. NPDC057668]|uniref:serine/threonine-protein kinase n=1 Tax=Nocardia sp. NPDC057668 TaxID=3346202 RepID=UPI0036734877